MFDAASEKLDALAGRAIFLDRSKRLRRAGSHDAGSGTRVFVRSKASRRRRAKDGVPLPPATLARRYRFLDEKITIRQDTLIAFIKAGLVRENTIRWEPWLDSGPLWAPMPTTTDAGKL